MRYKLVLIGKNDDTNSNSPVNLDIYFGNNAMNLVDVSEMVQVPQL